MPSDPLERAEWPRKADYQRWHARQIEIEQWMSLCEIHGIDEDDPRHVRLYREWETLEYMSNQ